MGLLSGVGKAAGGLFGGDFASRAARAQALMNDDYGAAAEITSRMQQGAAQQQKLQTQQKQLSAVRAGLAQRGYSQGDIDVIMANPDNASGLIREILQPRQFGPGGGSVGSVDPKTGQTSYQWAPRVDEDSNFYAPGPADRAPKLLQEGFKTVPVAPGGSVAVIGAATGLERGAGGPAATAPTQGPAPGTIEDGYEFMGGDPANPGSWKMVGGASSSGSSRTFP